MKMKFPILVLIMGVFGALCSAGQEAPAVTQEKTPIPLVMKEDKIRALLESGEDLNSFEGEKGITVLGAILLRCPQPDLVELALKRGASVKPSPTLKHYFSDYTFMISPHRDMPPEDAARIMTLLLDAGSDINALNRQGNSLRIHYGKIKTPAAAAIGEVLRERGAKLHPDAPSNRK